MSRTYRSKRDKFYRDYKDEKELPNGKVRDGSPTHATKSCKRNGGCPWCEGNRLHKYERRKPIEE